MHSLDQLGFNPFFSAQLELLAGREKLVAARVVADGGIRYRLGGCRASHGELSGKLLHTLSGIARPTTGDWVAVDDSGERAVIHHVFDRRTALRRRLASSDVGIQLIAANVDVFFIVTAADGDLEPRRLDRYRIGVADSGARAVVVVNKSDLVEDPGPLLQAIERPPPPGACGDGPQLGVPVIAVSARSGSGLDALREHLAPSVTFGFVGSSGVGKSSLVNRLVGSDLHATQEIRADGRGQHTTTARQLVVLEDGAVLLDTPGMREFGMVDTTTGLDDAFEDVATFTRACRFTDCRHEGEPGCAVQAAIDSGELDASRFASYCHLKREIAAIGRKQSNVASANAKRRWKSMNEQMRARTRLDSKLKG